MDIYPKDTNRSAASGERYPLPILISDGITPFDAHEQESSGRPPRRSHRGGRGGGRGRRHESASGRGNESERDRGNEWGRGRGGQSGRGRGNQSGRGQWGRKHNDEPGQMRRYNSVENFATETNRPRSHSSQRHAGQSMEAQGTRGRPPTSDTSRSGNPRRERIFGYRKLQELSADSSRPDNVVMELITPTSGFQTLLQKNEIKQDWIPMLFDVLTKACESNTRQSLLDLMKILNDSKLLIRHMPTYLTKLQLNVIVLDNTEKLLLSICSFMKELMQRIPDSYIDCIVVLDFLKKISQANPSMSEVKEEIAAVGEMIESIKTDVENQRLLQLQQGNRKHKDMENMPPPDDFKELSVLPELKDLHFNERPFLRANKVDGKYENLDHYLDVQFRLLREDYMQPLRNGILEYRREREHGNVKKRFQDIRLYHKVRIIRPVCTNRGILHVLQFDVSKMGGMRWESSKRLIHGSLLCLSQDDFETVLFATVTNRDPKELANGMIQVQFQGTISKVNEANASTEFLMAETTAYFEAYRHVLRGLQETTSDMPLQRYIVRCQKEVKPPDYILKDMDKRYDFTPLLKKRNSNYEYEEVPLIRSRYWPTAAELQLDDSQYEALNMAVTKEFALIQGPPGTGKTFVGLKIAELLIHNKSKWENSEADPILVVCYTNHALDQFVEGISVFCDSIARIGGRCNNPAIEPYMLKNLRKESKEKRSISEALYRRKNDCKREMYEYRTAIENVSTRLHVSTLGIVSEQILEEYMDPHHVRSLKSRATKDTAKENALESWLKFSVVDAQLEQTVQIESQNQKLKQWEDAVIQGVEFGPDSLQDVDAEKLWMYELVDRAAVYHLWLEDFQMNVRSELERVNSDIIFLRKHNTSEADQRQLQNHLQTVLNHSESHVLSEQTLMPHVEPLIQRQIKGLVTQSPATVDTNKSFIFAWLCLEPNTDTIKQVQDALQMIEVNDTIDVVGEADMEEMKRTIDDQYDEDDLSIPKISFTTDGSSVEKDLVFTFDDAGKSESGDSQWTSMQSKRSSRMAIKKMLSQVKPFSEQEESRFKDVWILTLEKRMALYKLWLHRYQTALRESIKETESLFADMCTGYQEVMDAEDAEIISGTTVVAMTTTGAAKYRLILQSIKPRIIIVEEAAEVLESHIVTTLGTACEHLILIGDHKQLRPTPTVYQLAIRFNLEISLFERMIKNEMKYVTLALQHRMRPEISEIMRHIYPDLMDDSSVKRYPRILGVDHNMFYIDHNYPETSNDETKSKSNQHEAEYVSSLCRYLLKQNYKPSQITVLTTYTGQMLALKKMMPKRDFEGVRITVVDNFQGEENDIILLSLVRSNKNDNVGFLKIENRICVALSRARHGFFVIGNFSLLSAQSDLWARITETLRSTNSIGTYLTLRCQNHQDSVIRASLKSDFDQTPNGGCRNPCDARLSCGHVCEQFCHVTDRKHEFVRCFKKCQKIICSQGHTCTKKCYEKCGECKTLVKKTLPLCKHTQECPCSKDPHLVKCLSKCTAVLKCGHPCSGKCGICRDNGRHVTDCKEPKTFILPCGHKTEGICSQDAKSLHCSVKCETTLKCGHTCQGSCYDCINGCIHVQCLEKCNRTLVCGHKCNQACSAPCQPCVKNCRIKCDHSKCKLKCGKSCMSCTEKCGWKCDHLNCGKLCGEMCDRLPCDMNCNKKTKCGHLCSGLCGEICPDLCLICDKDKIELLVPNTNENTTLTVLEDCRHVVATNTMDKLMRMENFSSIVPIALKTCPIQNCNQPILHSRRYGNIVKSIKNDIEKVKKQTCGEPEVIRRRMLRLKRMVEKLKSDDQVNANKLLKKLEDTDNATLTYLEFVEKQVQLLQMVHSLLSILIPHTTKHLEVYGCIKSGLLLLLTWIMKSKRKCKKTAVELEWQERQSFSLHELHDVSIELNRFGLLTSFLIIIDDSQASEEKKKYFETVKIYIDKLQTTTPIDRKLIERAMLYFRLLSHGIPVLQSVTLPFDKLALERTHVGIWMKCVEGGHVFPETSQTALMECPYCEKEPSTIVKTSKEKMKEVGPIEKSYYRETSASRRDSEASRTTDIGSEMTKQLSAFLNVSSLRNSDKDSEMEGADNLMTNHDNIRAVEGVEPDGANVMVTPRSLRRAQVIVPNKNVLP